MFNPFRKKIKMMTVRFHMKSGREIRVECANIKITKNGNDLIAYSLESVDKRYGDPTFYIHLDSIEAITTLTR